MIQMAVIGSSQLSKKIKSYLEYYSVQCNDDIETTLYTDMNKLYKSISLNCAFDLIFLDLDIENALTTGTYIRDTLFHKTTDIIFVSIKNSCPAEFIKIRPVDYLTYPFDYTAFKECISRYMKWRGLIFDLFSFMKNKTEYRIAVSKILYLQSSGKKVIIHTKNECIEFYGKLSDCKTKACFKNFIEIHQSFFVNKMYIEQLYRTYLIISGGYILPISRQKLQTVKHFFNMKENVDYD